MTGLIVKARAVNQSKLERHPERQRAFDELVEAQAIKSRALGQVKNQIIDLSLSMAQQIIQQSIQLQPELLDQLYQRALGPLNRLTEDQGLLHVSVDDSQTDLTQLARKIGFKVVTNTNIALGGCIVEVGGLQIDATVETALKTLSGTLKEHAHE